MSHTDIESYKDAGVKLHEHADSKLRTKSVELKKRFVDPSMQKVSSHYNAQPALTVSRLATAP
jgi:hypothetical protein